MDHHPTPPLRLSFARHGRDTERQMPVATLTEISIRHLKAPDKGQLIYTEQSFKGFGVRVTPGSKSYVLTYGADRRRVTLGDVSAMSLKKAREKAREILTAKEDELDEKPTLIFKAARDTFLAMHVKPNNKASTA